MGEAGGAQACGAIAEVMYIMMTENAEEESEIACVSQNHDP